LSNLLRGSLDSEVSTHPICYTNWDLVRSGLDGSLLFVGRRDNQIKIRGQRVELDEVQTVVLQVSPKSHVTVELAKNESSSGVLVALILQKESANAPASKSSSLFHPPSSVFREPVSAVVSSLRETMLLYMIPTVSLPLAYLPKPPTGKVNRKLLREHIGSSLREKLEAYSMVEATRRVPLTPLEARLQEYVGRVLHRSADRIPFDQDLFAVSTYSFYSYGSSYDSSRREIDDIRAYYLAAFPAVRVGP
jgi:hypothetical protein